MKPKLEEHSGEMEDETTIKAEITNGNSHSNGNSEFCSTPEPEFCLSAKEISSLPEIYDYFEGEPVNHAEKILNLMIDQYRERKFDGEHSRYLIAILYRDYRNNPDNPDTTNIEQILFDLLNMTTDQDKIGAKKIALLLLEPLDICQKLVPSFSSIFIDIIAMVCMQLFTTKDLELLRGDSSIRRKLYEDNPKLKRILEFITGTTSTIPEKLFSLRLEPEILYVTKISSTAPQHYTRRYMQIRTSLYYKQKRFNLIREETEGFSKLITELSNMLDDPTYSITLALNTVKSLIGCFKLDGNKVLNCLLVALEHCENENEQSRMVQLLRKYIELADDGSTPANLIAFRLENCKSHDNDKVSLQKCSESWFRMMAVLIKEKIISLEEVWNCMKPDNDRIIKYYDDSLNSVIKEATKTKVSLNEDASKDKDKETLSNITLNLSFNNYQKSRIVPYLWGFFK